MDLSGAIWRTSSYSVNGGAGCLEIAVNLPGIVAVRDSEDPGGQALTFTEAEWHVFATAVRSGHYDEP
jgi:hypothetical protein